MNTDKIINVLHETEANADLMIKRFQKIKEDSIRERKKLEGELVPRRKTALQVNPSAIIAKRNAFINKKVASGN